MEKSSLCGTFQNRAVELRRQGGEGGLKILGLKDFGVKGFQG